MSEVENSSREMTLTGMEEDSREMISVVNDGEQGFYEISALELSTEKKAELLVQQMTPQEIVGQLFMFGYAGKEAGKDILDWVARRQIGGVKIFGWNGTDIGEICRSVTKVQEAAGTTRLEIPLFIATDQEGGWVRHIKAETSKTPGNMAIAAAGFLEDSYLSSYYIAQELHNLGINMNFAPTVDLYLDKESRIINSRAFSKDPIFTANLAVAFFQGHKIQKVLATAKHFPGHGNSKEDSHGRLPVIDSDLDFLYQNDLVPYELLIRESIPAIMSGHISFPQITGKNEPATLSYSLLTELLRNKLNYKGIVITDDLNMAGMQKKGVETGDKSLEALKAGNDIVLISKKNSDPRQYQIQWQKVMNEYETDPEFQRTAQESAKRILQIKFEYLTGENIVPLFPKEEVAKSKIPSPEAEVFFFNQACRSITQVSTIAAPISSTAPVLLAGYYSDFFSEGRKRFPKNSSFDAFTALRNGSVTEVANQIQSILRKDEVLIISVSTKSSLALAKMLKKRGVKTFALSSSMPGHALELQEMDYALAIYGTNRASYQAAFAVFAGDFSPTGKLPF